MRRCPWKDLNEAMWFAFLAFMLACFFILGWNLVDWKYPPLEKSNHQYKVIFTSSTWAAFVEASSEEDARNKLAKGEAKGTFYIIEPQVARVEAVK